MRVGGAFFLWALSVVPACGGEEFSSTGQGTGATTSTGGAAASGGVGGAGGRATGGAGGANGGAGGTAGGAGGTTAGAGGAGGAPGGAGGAPGGTGGLPACSSGVCAPAVPGGWSGPIAIIDVPSGSAPACGGDYAKQELLAHNKLSGSAPPPQCGCSCDHSGVTCSNVRIDAYAAGTCSGACCGGTACASLGLASGACIAAGPALCTGVTHAQVKVDVNKSCAPSVLTNLDNITWTRTIRGCAPSGSESCPGGVCVPSPTTPTTGRLCITKDGDNSCPGAYSQKIAIWETMDNRTCSNACSCLPPVCGSIQAFAAAGCTSPLGQSSVPMNCASALVGTGVLSTKFTAAPPSCTAVGTPVAGGEVQQDPVTLCCLPGGG